MFNQANRRLNDFESAIHRVALFAAVAVFLGSCGSGGVIECGEPPPVDFVYELSEQADGRRVNDILLSPIIAGTLVYENPAVSFQYTTIAGEFEATFEVTRDHSAVCLFDG